MMAFLTFVTILAFSGLCLICSHADKEGKTSFTFAFLALLVWYLVRRLVEGHDLTGAWLIVAGAAMLYAFYGGLKGLVKGRGPGRIPPLGAAVGLGWIMFMMGSDYFGEERRIDVRLNELVERRAELEQRLDRKIPEFHDRLERDARAARKDLAEASADQRVRLENELREIARLFVAVEKEKGDTLNLIQRLKQEERRLERLRASREILDENDESFIAELNEVWRQSAERLAAPLDAQLDGALDDAAVEAKLQELMGR